MAGTTPIALTVLAPGTHEFGPAPLADTDTHALLTIDRTVTSGGTQGFNGQPATTTCQIAIYQSSNGGTTWDLLEQAGFTGGTVVRRGTEIDETDIGVNLWPGTGRQARAEVVIAGAPVAVQGTLAIT
jgi:hypothetical protein